jgi:hypothetical protein
MLTGSFECNSAGIAKYSPLIGGRGGALLSSGVGRFPAASRRQCAPFLACEEAISGERRRNNGRGDTMASNGCIRCICVVSCGELPACLLAPWRCGFETTCRAAVASAARSACHVVSASRLVRSGAMRGLNRRHQREGMEPFTIGTITHDRRASPASIPQVVTICVLRRSDSDILGVSSSPASLTKSTWEMHVRQGDAVS